MKASVYKITVDPVTGQETSHLQATKPMTKHITVTLTEDQIRFIATLIEDYVIYSVVKQGEARRSFARRVHQILAIAKN